MRNIFGEKELEEITEADLNRLIELEVRENRFVEFKRDMYGPKDSDKTEMLADISAFANAQGGYLFIGIEEDGDGKAKQIMGITDFTQAAEKIRNLCQTSLDEYIQGLRIQSVSLSNGHGVLVIAVPNSSTKPHMITFQNKNRFYIRRDEGKDLMNVEEIRDTVIQVEDSVRKIEDFLDSRKTNIQSELADIVKKDVGCWVILMATPIYINQERLDVATNENINKTILEVQSTAESIFGYTIDRLHPHVVLEGLSFNNYDSEKMKQGDAEYIDVWNNGYIEYGCWLEYYSKSNMEVRNQRIYNNIISYLLPNPTIPNKLYVLCHIIKQLWNIMQVNEPTVYRLMIINCKNMILENTPYYTLRNELDIKPLKFYLDASSSEVSQELITKLFRCYGLTRPIYGENNEFLFDHGEYKPLKGLKL